MYLTYMYGEEENAKVAPFAKRMWRTPYIHHIIVWTLVFCEAVMGDAFACSMRILPCAERFGEARASTE